MTTPNRRLFTPDYRLDARQLQRLEERSRQMERMEFSGAPYLQSSAGTVVGVPPSVASAPPSGITFVSPSGPLGPYGISGGIGGTLLPTVYDSFLSNWILQQGIPYPAGQGGSGGIDNPPNPVWALVLQNFGNGTDGGPVYSLFPSRYYAVIKHALSSFSPGPGVPTRQLYIVLNADPGIPPPPIVGAAKFHGQASFFNSGGSNWSSSIQDYAQGSMTVQLIPSPGVGHPSITVPQAGLYSIVGRCEGDKASPDGLDTIAIFLSINPQLYPNGYGGEIASASTLRTSPSAGGLMSNGSNAGPPFDAIEVVTHAHLNAGDVVAINGASGTSNNLKFDVSLAVVQIH